MRTAASSSDGPLGASSDADSSSLESRPSTAWGTSSSSPTSLMLVSLSLSLSFDEPFDESRAFEEPFDCFFSEALDAESSEEMELETSLSESESESESEEDEEDEASRSGPRSCIMSLRSAKTASCASISASSAAVRGLSRPRLFFRFPERGWSGQFSGSFSVSKETTFLALASDSKITMTCFRWKHTFLMRTRIRFCCDFDFQWHFVPSSTHLGRSSGLSP
mmetsp:Transcript_81598/g.176359  ORF Transcript_81598/g.176359 Transcript_81598/m.176359 type:complete len:222 (-) Transcript_81598:1453-2118(-)